MELHDLAPSVREFRDRLVEITEPHRPALWRYCLRLTGSPWDAEDLVQETLLRAFARLSHLWQPIHDCRAYLFRIASNAWIDAMRRASSRSALEEELPDDIPDDATADVAEARADAGEALSRLVALLPPRQRVALLLSEVFGFKNREIGAMIGVTEGAVKAILSRARTTLHQRRAEAELAFLFGEPAICIYQVLPGRPRTLMWLIRLGLSRGKVCRWTAYFFTPELIRHAAAALGVPAAPAGYRYIVGDVPE